MKNEFGKNLKRLREENQLTIEGLANSVNEKYGVNFNKNMIVKWENGHSINLSSIKVFSSYFDTSLNELLGYEGKETENMIPIYVGVDLKKAELTEENKIGHAHIPPLIASKRMSDLFYLYVKNNSAGYANSRLLLVDRNTDIENGDRIVVLMKSEEKVTLAKGKYKNGDVLKIIPVNGNLQLSINAISSKNIKYKIMGKVISTTIVH